jgi:uncharacterized membrane protein
MKGADLATIETVEADIDKLKADVKTVIANVETETTPKAAEDSAATKSREGEVKTIAPTESKNEVKTASTEDNQRGSAAKPKEGEAKAVAPAQDKAKDGIEKAKTGVVYISKAKFWIAVCLAFLFGVAVGSFICTYATRSSPPSSSQ